MHKKIGSTFLVAGTCIGLGLIALPMVLAPLGLIPSILAMLIIWWTMYYSSLASLELNLQAGTGLPLGALSRRFSGRGAEWIGIISLKLLSGALLCGYIDAGASNIQKLFFPVSTPRGTTFTLLTLLYSLIIVIILQLPMKFIDYVNRILFFGLLGVFSLLVIGLMFTTQWSNIPLFGNHITEFWAWRQALPVLFTSFGFQVIFHTLTNYCNKDARVLKQAFFWGSLIAGAVYSIWASAALTIINTNAPDFYHKMAAGLISDPSSLTYILSSIALWPSIQILVWVITLLAIITSVVGVGMGLCDSLSTSLEKYISNVRFRSLIAACGTILPSSLVILYFPTIFLSALAFAGMILVIIAILLPTYLFLRISSCKLFYPGLKHRWLIWLTVVIGLAIMGAEIINMVLK